MPPCSLPALPRVFATAEKSSLACANATEESSKKTKRADWRIAFLLNQCGGPCTGNLKPETDLLAPALKDQGPVGPAEAEAVGKRIVKRRFTRFVWDVI